MRGAVKAVALAGLLSACAASTPPETYPLPPITPPSTGRHYRQPRAAKPAPPQINPDLQDIERQVRELRDRLDKEP